MLGERGRGLHQFLTILDGGRISVAALSVGLAMGAYDEAFKYAKERPGQLSYSSSGIGGAPHLTAELLKQKFGFDMAHVPYRNSPQSIADVAAGHVAASVAEAESLGKSRYVLTLLLVATAVLQLVVLAVLLRSR